MDYRRAFIYAARRQPWWQWFGIGLFNLFNLSAADYFRLWRGLGTTAKDALWTAAVALTALLMYKTGGDAWREIQKQKTKLEARLKPKVHVVFDPNRYPACFHESKWTDAGTHGIDRMFRVGLVNLSDGETVDDVEVLLAELVGLDRPQDTRFLPVPLLRMTSTPLVAGEVFRSFSLHPGKTPVFVEVAFKRSTVNEISLRYADRWPNTLEPDNRYRLRIVVKSRNAPEVDARFLMSVDGHGVLHFESDTGR